MRGNACSVSSFIRACVCLFLCILCACVCVSVSISAGRGNDDGWRAKEGLRQLCAVRVLWWYSGWVTYILCVSYIRPWVQYPKHGMVNFHALAENINSLCWQRALCQRILGVLCECVYESLSFFWAFPCSFCSLWADSCVAMVWSTDVWVYNETVLHSPRRSPCCEAVCIRLLSRAGPKG